MEFYNEKWDIALNNSALTMQKITISKKIFINWSHILNWGKRNERGALSKSSQARTPSLTVIYYVATEQSKMF